MIFLNVMLLFCRLSSDPKTMECIKKQNFRHTVMLCCFNSRLFFFFRRTHCCNPLRDLRDIFPPSERSCTDLPDLTFVLLNIFYSFLKFIPIFSEKYIVWGRRPRTIYSTGNWYNLLKAIAYTMYIIEMSYTLYYSCKE